MSRQEWIEVFEQIHHRKPTPLELKQAIADGEIQLSPSKGRLSLLVLVLAMLVITVVAWFMVDSSRQTAQQSQLATTSKPSIQASSSRSSSSQPSSSSSRQQSIEEQMNQFVQQYSTDTDNSVKTHTDKIAKYFLDTENANYQASLADINDRTYKGFETTHEALTDLKQSGDTITFSTIFTRTLLYTDNRPDEHVRYQRDWTIKKVDGHYYIDHYDTKAAEGGGGVPENPGATNKESQEIDGKQLEQSNFSSIVGSWETEDGSDRLNITSDGSMDDLTYLKIDKDVGQYIAGWRVNKSNVGKSYNVYIIKKGVSARPALGIDSSDYDRIVIGDGNERKIYYRSSDLAK